MKETKKDIVVGTTVAGQPIYITCYTIDSEKPGKTFYLQGGIHGGEITLHMIRDIYNEVKKHIVCGKVKFVPFANPTGWAQKAYAYTVGKFNYKTGEDFNRTYGKKTLDSATSAISREILKECEEADAIIDLHTAHTSFPHTITMSEKDLELAKLANIEYNRLCFGSEEYKTTLDGQLCDKKPAFTIECGSHDDINEEYKIDVVKGVLNVIASLGIIDTVPQQNKKRQVAFSKSVSYFAECGGIVDFKKGLGESFKKGETLYIIMPANLQEKEIEVKAEFDGIVFRFAKTHIYNSFDEVMRVFNLNDLKPI